MTLKHHIYCYKSGWLLQVSGVILQGKGDQSERQPVSAEATKGTRADATQGQRDFADVVELVLS